MEPKRVKESFNFIDEVVATVTGDAEAQWNIAKGKCVKANEKWKAEMKARGLDEKTSHMGFVNDKDDKQLQKVAKKYGKVLEKGIKVMENYGKHLEEK